MKYLKQFNESLSNHIDIRQHIVDEVKLCTHLLSDEGFNVKVYIDEGLNGESRVNYFINVTIHSEEMDKEVINIINSDYDYGETIDKLDVMCQIKNKLDQEEFYLEFKERLSDIIQEKGYNGLIGSIFYYSSRLQYYYNLYSVKCKSIKV